MDLKKQIEYLNPTIEDKIQIIGVGAIGSTVAEMLVRMGFTNIKMYDFDTVDSHNITNQMYNQLQIGKTKLTALSETLNSINPAVELTLVEEGWNGQRLSGYVFLCVDNIDLRRQIVEENFNNENIRVMFDFRMRLVDAQHYAAAWAVKKQKENFLSTMQFSHKEAKEATPISACGTELNVVTTVRMIVSAGIQNFINWLHNKPLKNMVLLSTEDMDFFATPN